MELICMLLIYLATFCKFASGKICDSANTNTRRRIFPLRPESGNTYNEVNSINAVSRLTCVQKCLTGRGCNGIGFSSGNVNSNCKHYDVPLKDNGNQLLEINPITGVMSGNPSVSIKVEDICTIDRPVHGQWSSWTEGQCSVTCGVGNLTEVRNCSNPSPDHGGIDCSGQATNTLSCTLSPCSVNGGWSIWQTVGSCTLTCGTGQIVENRECNDPTPANGGLDCTGNSSQTLVCNTNLCPVDGGWSAWATQGACTVSCGGGEITEIRACDSPIPANNGSVCIGDASKTVACNANTCVVSYWSDWEAAGTCVSHCGYGELEETRSCVDPTSITPCIGQATRTSSCDPAPIPGWTKVLRRIDGSVDFYLTYAEYKTGFGSSSGNYWIGLEQVHLLTSTGKKVRFAMTDGNGVETYAEFGNFAVTGESDSYRMTVGAKVAGDAVDAFTKTSGWQFTTKDHDNDARITNGNCAKIKMAAGWYKNCCDADIFGRYFPGEQDNKSILRWPNGAIAAYHGLSCLEMSIEN